MRLVGIFDPQWNFGSTLANRLALDTLLIGRNFCQVSNSLNSFNFSHACSPALSHRHANNSSYRCITRSLFLSVVRLSSSLLTPPTTGALPALSSPPCPSRVSFPLQATPATGVYYLLPLSVAHLSSTANYSSYKFTACSLFLAVALLLLQVQCLLSPDAHEFVHRINRINETRAVKMGCAN